MTESVVMNIKNDALTYGESRSQPFIIWLQFMNFAMVTTLCWLSLKVYRGFQLLREWIFPFRANKFYNPLILVLGTENDLNEEIVKQLSGLFHSKVIQLKDINDNVLSELPCSGKESRIIYTQVREATWGGITKLSFSIRNTFGEIDLLVISQIDEPMRTADSTHGFLNNLNKQLLTQFWIVMAFLPRMLERNNGQIVSLAMGRTSSLTNTGIVRSVCEEVLLSETNVKLKLVERNSFVEHYLPSLPCDIVARLIIRSIWTSSTFVRVPTISQYLFMMPLVITRGIFYSVLKIVNVIMGGSKLHEKTRGRENYISLDWKNKSYERNCK